MIARKFYFSREREGGGGRVWEAQMTRNGESRWIKRINILLNKHGTRLLILDI